MESLSLLEEIRFGYGPLAGTTPSPGGLEPDRVLAQLTATDTAAAAWDRPLLADRYTLIAAYIDANKARKASKDTAKPPKDENDPRIKIKQMEHLDVASFVARPAVATLGFVERLVNFWANRITVAGNVDHYVQSFRDEAIRPNIAGRYADMLKATLWHPAMQNYLSQTGSIGPDSPIGQLKNKGLNENLAREFLELHSMGHGYTQTDVTEFAKLLAGMSQDEKGRKVDKKRAEPGDKHILGATYTEGIEQIDAFVEVVAHRQETADAVAFFMARHFIADAPPADLVTALSAAYLANDTELVPVYRTMLEHPLASDVIRTKIRSPQEYLVASLRLLGMDGQEKGLLGFPQANMMLNVRLTSMGQPTYKPLRPDGWPEVAAGWMTPPMMAARIDWAVDISRAMGDQASPVDLVDFAMGDLATPLLRRAVGGAEQRWEGLAVLIASPDFSRR